MLTMSEVFMPARLHGYAVSGHYRDGQGAWRRGGPRANDGGCGIFRRGREVGIDERGNMVNVIFREARGLFQARCIALG